MSWPVVQIKEVARVVGGATPKSAVEAYWGGEVHWATPKDLTGLQGKNINATPRRITEEGLRSCAAELLPPHSVLFSSRAPIGHVAINTVPMATNQGFKSMIPGPKLDPGYLYWWLDAHRERLQSLGNGATFKEVSKAVVERVEIPLPPLEEQKRIAAILDQADALRRLRRRGLDRLNTLGQAIFHEMFGASERAVDTVQLSDLVRPGDRINYGVVQPGPEVCDGVPLLRVSDLLSPGLDPGEFRKVSLGVDRRHAKSRLDGDEILLACVGSIGTVAKAHPGLRGVNIARAVARIPVDSAKANREYLFQVLRTDGVQRYFTQEIRLVAQPTLNIKQISEARIPLPPRGAQDDFDVKVSQVEAQRVSMALAEFRAARLFDSLLHRAFRGEI